MVDEAVPAERVEALIRQAGGELLQDVRLFDLFRGEADRRGQEEPGVRAHLPGGGPDADRRGGRRASVRPSCAPWRSTRRATARLRWVRRTATGRTGCAPFA